MIRVWYAHTDDPFFVPIFSRSGSSHDLFARDNLILFLKMLSYVKKCQTSRVERLTEKSLGIKPRSVELRMALLVGMPVVRVWHVRMVVKQRFVVVGVSMSFR